MHKRAEQDSGQADGCGTAAEAAWHEMAGPAPPITVVTDADYRCAWRPCDALETEECGSAPR